MKKLLCGGSHESILADLTADLPVKHRLPQVQRLAGCIILNCIYAQGGEYPLCAHGDFFPNGYKNSLKEKTLLLGKNGKDYLKKFENIYLLIEELDVLRGTEWRFIDMDSFQNLKKPLINSLLSLNIVEGELWDLCEEFFQSCEMISQANSSQSIRILLNPSVKIYKKIQSLIWIMLDEFSNEVEEELKKLEEESKN